MDKMVIMMVDFKHLSNRERTVLVLERMPEVFTLDDIREEFKIQDNNISISLMAYMIRHKEIVPTKETIMKRYRKYIRNGERNEIWYTE